ncbi:hypothetical protein [Thiorhodococcus minor]|nr:hypothetical protein [Thiorhodococcus minor]
MAGPPAMATIHPDVDQCATEPIHLAGAIHPDGLLLVLHETDWRIV